MDIIKISQLPISSEIQGNEILPIVQDSTTKQVAYEDMDNKVYDPTNHSGLGYKRLKKNGGILTQSMINSANTIYEIRYDYDLNGAIITIPEGCILEFKGGSLGNGTLVGNNTAINAGLIKIFNDITVNGGWSTFYFIPQWFGAKGDGITDDTIPFITLFNMGVFVKIPNGEYIINGTINIYNNVLCEGKIKYGGSQTAFQVLNKISPSSDYPRCLIISGLTVYSESYNNVTALLIKRPVTFIEKCLVYNFKIGICITSYSVKVNNCVSRLCDRNLVIYGIDLNTMTANDILIDGGNYDSPSSGTSISIGGDEEGTSITSDEYHGTNIKISNLACDGGSIIINQAQNIYISNVYSEFALNGAIIINNLKRLVSQINIDNCFLSSAQYGVKTFGKTFGISITNNTIYYNISKCAIYIEDTTFGKGEIVIKNNNIEHPSFTGIKKIHIGGSISSGKIVKFNNNIYCDNFNLYGGIQRCSKDSEYISPSSIIEDDSQDIHYNIMHNCWSGLRYSNPSSISAVFNGWSSVSDALLYTDKTLIKKFNPLDYIVVSDGAITAQYCIYKIDYDNKLIHLSSIISGGTLVVGNTYTIYQVGFSYKRIAFASSNNAEYISPQNGDVILDENLSKGGTCIGKYYNGTSYENMFPFIKYGSTANRPNLGSDIRGLQYFDENLMCQLLWDGDKWLRGNFNAVYRIKGDTSSRPVLSTDDSSFTYYDTTLSKMILWNGSSWTNLDGTILV